MGTEIATPFTPLLSLGGGILLGVSAIALMLLMGRIAGISGITSGVMGIVMPMTRAASDAGWRIAFLVGLIVAPLGYALLTGAMPVQTVSGNLPLMAMAGLLVGIGSALGSGCTSGHGVCGLARLSPRALAAVATFMASGAGTVFVLRHVIGG